MHLNYSTKLVNAKLKRIKAHAQYMVLNKYNKNLLRIYKIKTPPGRTREEFFKLSFANLNR